ncbi:MAG: lytic transglycosylase domain-containing protein [Treponema sp.]|nr:lytic transglycosylase domain-containing protein [Treponema sp.]
MVILFLFLCTNSCAGPQIQNDFYRGLSGTNPVPSFEKALADPNPYIRSAAAGELARMMYQGTALSGKTVERVRRESTGAWAEAFDVVDKIPDKENALAFLLNFEQDAAIPIEAGLYVLREFEKQSSGFSETELAAIDGHFAVLRLRYNEALAFFRKFMEDESWPEQLPQMFLKYPSLINDLGRAFQYTSSGNEGLNLFLQWSAKLEKTSNEDDLRYRLLFFSARIARRRGLNGQALSLFEQVRPLAPAGEQLDACIWYILDLSAGGSGDVFIKRLEQLVPHWHKDIYFDDILEKFLQARVEKKDWEKIIRTFDVIKTSGAVSTSGYAWVIARIIEEGYLSDSETRLAAAVTRETSAAPAVFFRKAYDAGNSVDSSAFYYRSLSASALDLPFLELPAAVPQTGGGAKQSPALQFLLGFFSNNAASHSLKFIKALEKDLSAGELRAIAQAFAKDGMYAQSIRQVSGYVNRDGYTFNRDDLELLFPRPYKELTEKYAGEHGIAPAIMFGLIRTESAFENKIVSRAGAVGLTQIMPETAKDMAGRIRRAGGPDFIDENKNIDLSDPELNIHIGSFYLNYLMGRFDDMLISLMAYNSGMNRVRRLHSANKMPSDLFMETISIYETRDYGRKVMSAGAVYEELYYR